MNGTMPKQQNSPMIDIMKFIMSFLVVGIHTEPFESNVWLDRGFAVVTRLCVPFFFIAGAYFLFLKEKPLKKYLARIGGLYVIWSVIYLPFDIEKLGELTPLKIIVRYFWAGNEHALWYLCGTFIGTGFVYLLQKVLSEKKVLLISFVLMVIGCIISTWSPLSNSVTGLDLRYIGNVIGVRNGIFYAPVYISLGMCIARNQVKKRTDRFYAAMLLGSIALLAGECWIFVVKYNTASSVLWISVFPAAFSFFELVLNAKWKTESRFPRFAGRMSSMIFVSHNLFIIFLEERLHGITLYICVACLSAVLAAVTVKLSEKVKILRYIY